ncbi:MAG TPA: carboxymuconolactone decarboxylase family protein [Jatrophihabitans sp.]|nr:carboxymuconolactone decarboxylase family protein [Jatrophihabitans sp.]
MFGMLSTRPDLLEAVVSGYLGVFGDGALDRRTKELIASWTSQVNGCPYCVGTHNYFLQLFGGSKELATAIQGARSEDDLPVDERTKSLLRLVTTVCRHAYKVSDSLWQETLAAGWSSEQLFEAVFTTALFNSITRLVDGLGLGQSVAQSRTSMMEPDGG